MRHGYRAPMDEHPLRREIITTQVVNDVINNAGITFFHRLSQETGATSDELCRANLIVREIYAAQPLLDEINALDNVIAADTQIDMRLAVRTLAERASRWMVNNRRSPLDSEAIVEYFGHDVERVVSAMPDLVVGWAAELFTKRREGLLEREVPESLATRIAALPPSYSALGIVEIARSVRTDPIDVAKVHFAVAEMLGIGPLTQRIGALPRTDRWQTMARAALRDDLHGVHGQITAQVLRTTDGTLDADERVKHWAEHEGVVLNKAASTLEEVWKEEAPDLARLSVGLRVVRTLLQQPS
jgi:glutamate dehydrogenase